MRAAYYEQNGSARDVLKIGEVDTPRPGPGEVRVKLATSGVNPSDVKARSGANPQDRLSARDSRIATVPAKSTRSATASSPSRVGERVWIWNAQWAARLRHLRRICRAAVGAGGAASGQYQFRGRRLFRHSGDDGLSRRCGLRRGARRDGSGRRRRGRRRPLRRAVRQGGRRHGHHDHKFAGEGQDGARQPAPTTPSTTSAKMSASASWRSPARSGVEPSSNWTSPPMPSSSRGAASARHGRRLRDGHAECEMPLHVLFAQRDHAEIHLCL